MTTTNACNNGALLGINFMNGIGNASENVIISPLLLESTLALLYLGSDGHTADELRHLLHLERFKNNVEMANYYAGHFDLLTRESDTQLQLSSTILLNQRYTMGEEFPKIAMKYFHTKASQIKLDDIEKLRAYINANIVHIARDINESLLSATFEPEVAAILLMVGNFKNKWFLPFSAYRSGLYEFHIDATQQKMIPMLYDNDMFVKFAEFRELDARGIELPFEHDDELSMLILLPNRRDGLPQLLEQLKVHRLSALVEQMQMENVQVLLPKFHIECERSWRADLEQLGIRTIFTKDANFSNMISKNCTDSPVRINEILQKICIQIHESGSEPSKLETSKPIAVSNSIDPRQKFFRADHPFYFAIRNGDVDYFVGHVAVF